MIVVMTMIFSRLVRMRMLVIDPIGVNIYGTYIIWHRGRISVMDWSSERRYIIYLEVHSQIDSQRLEISRERSQTT